jgi:hypothetical protein
MSTERVITDKPDYLNKELKEVSKEDLIAALKETNRKNDEHRESMQRGFNEAMRGGPDPIIAYLRRVSKGHHTEFRIVVRTDGTAYIHPFGQDGETLDFNIH